MSEQFEQPEQSEQKKQRKLALLIIILIVAAGVAYFLWAFVFNKGTLVFKGTSSFDVKVQNSQYLCEEALCEFSLGKGEINYEILKEGFYPQTGTITLERGETVEIDVDLKFISEFKAPIDYDIYNLPVGYSKFAGSLLEISLFNSFDANYDLKRLPKKIENIVFASSGQMAAVFEKDEMSIYKVDDSSLVGVEGLSGAVHGDFNADQSAFYTLVFDEEVKKYALVRVATEDHSTENIVFFIRDVDEYSLKVSSDETMAILIDKTNNPEILYKIDLTEKSRKNIYEGEAIALGEFSDDGSMIVFQEGLKLKYYNFADMAVYEFGFIGDLNRFSFAPESKAYFVSDSGYADSGFGIEFMKGATDLTVEDLFDEAGPQKIDTLFEWDYRLKEFSEVTALDFEEEVRKIEVGSDGLEVRFLVGDQIYDLVIGV